MTSFRQIEANRRNAIKSTGPSTEEGKRRSRRNAIRHGLCAETVIENIEDVEDYRAFEAAVTADYDVGTAVERELVLRLASLLWRLRRATAIETDLLRIQAEILQDRRPRFAMKPQMMVASSDSTIKLRLALTLAHRETSHHEIWRNASSGSPLSTTACSSGLGAMKPRSGARWCRRFMHWGQSDASGKAATPYSQTTGLLRSLARIATTKPLCARTPSRSENGFAS